MLFKHHREKGSVKRGLPLLERPIRVHMGKVGGVRSSPGCLSTPTVVLPLIVASNVVSRYRFGSNADVLGLPK
jgi:hypothetical protein